MNYRDPTLRQRLADEYVLGTLQGAARQRFERLLQHDVALRATVQETAQRWNVLVETLPPLQPSAALWRHIERRIAPVLHAPAWPWHRLGFWRGWALVASALAAMLLLYIGMAPPAVTYVVVITDDAQARASWLLSATAPGRELRVATFAPQLLPPDRVFQLWVKLPGVAAVQSVGLIPASGRATLSVPEPLVPLLAGHPPASLPPPHSIMAVHRCSSKHGIRRMAPPVWRGTSLLARCIRCVERIVTSKALCIPSCFQSYDSPAPAITRMRDAQGAVHDARTAISSSRASNCGLVAHCRMEAQHWLRVLSQIACDAVVYRPLPRGSRYSLIFEVYIGGCS